MTTYDEEDCEDDNEASLNFLTGGKVSFPELGMDIVDDDGHESDNVVSDISWHHNWLFKQQLQHSDQSRQYPAPVSMLVPNPLNNAKVKIGEKDLDLVSELSEYVSIASFAASVSSGSDDEMEVSHEVSEEKHEADQEYTIYEQLPTRRQLSSNDLVSRSSQDNNKSPGDLEWIQRPPNISTHQGKIVTIMCQVSGSKPTGTKLDLNRNLSLTHFISDIAWFKKSKPIEKDRFKYWSYRRKNHFFLTIFDVKNEDCGNYSMAAFNKTGEIWHSLEMTVKGKMQKHNNQDQA